MITLSEAIENQITVTGNDNFYVWFTDENWYDLSTIDAEKLHTDIEELEYSFVKVVHIFSDSRGIYIPRDFAQDFPEYLEQEDCEVLLDPNHEQYWETWNDVLEYVRIPSEGLLYHLFQDGDLYAIAYL